MPDTPNAAYSFDWEDCAGNFQVGVSVARGCGIRPSMVNVDAEDMNGSISAHDARSLAAVLVAAAEACEASGPSEETAARSWREEHQREDGSYDAETWGEVDEDGKRVG
jgi:hypothetical protein